MKYFHFKFYLLLLVIALCQSSKFWHITDLHLDYLYTAGGNQTNFCHEIITNNNDTINNETSDVTEYGDYNCDSPKLLVDSALQAMQDIEPKPDFIIWTGDSAPHWRDPAPPDMAYITNVTSYVFSRLDTYFPGVAVVPALGNHDASPPDQFPIVSADKPHKSNATRMYEQLLTDGAFEDHIGTEAVGMFRRCGYYSKLVSVGFIKWRFIVLNTNIYYHDDYSEGEDPCGQLAWLNDTLNTVGDDEHVIIVAHVPPGSFERDPGLLNFNSPNATAADINKKFLQIVTDPVNSDKIVAHLYGHLHTDTFRLFLDRATRSKPVGVSFMAGSVTPVLWVNHSSVGVNPTLRLFETRDTTIADYSEFYYDLNDIDVIQDAVKNSEIIDTTVKPNENDGSDVSKDAMNINGSETTVKPSENQTETETGMATTESSGEVTHWKLLYRATEVYNVSDLSPNSMFEAFKYMADAESDIFEKYYNYNTGAHEVGDCIESCKRGHLCSIVNIVVEELTDCLEHPDDSTKLFEVIPVHDATAIQSSSSTSTTTTTTTTTTTSTTSTTTTPTSATDLITPVQVDEDDVNKKVTDAIVETNNIDGEVDDNSVVKSKVKVDNSVSAVGVFFGVVAILLILLAAGFAYKKYRDNRYRNQEFLLTDSVFRYDGYSQLEDP